MVKPHMSMYQLIKMDIKIFHVKMDIKIFHIYTLIKKFREPDHGCFISHCSFMQRDSWDLSKIENIDKIELEYPMNSNVIQHITPYNLHHLAMIFF